MHTVSKIAVAGAVLASGALVAGPAQAATEHCEPGLSKVEVDAGPSIATTLPEGTPVCIKAGTRTYLTTVRDGRITNDSITNKPGTAYLGISYYVVYKVTKPTS